MSGTHTIRSIAAALDKDKRTVQNWLAAAKAEHGELGKLDNGTRVFDDNERDILLSYGSESARAKVAAAAPETFIKSSGLAAVAVDAVVMPEGFDPSAMVRHFDGVVGTATDIDSLMAIVDMATGAAQKVMDEKIAQQKAELDKAKRAKEAIARRIADTQQALAISALESRILAGQQTEATTAAQQAFAELMNMGKSEESAS